jgi:tripeptide aminopeptidase
VRARIERILADSRVRRAFHFLSENESHVEADQIRLSLIPAPPFGEEMRGRAFADELRRLDLRPVTDAIGNVIAAFRSFGPNPVVIGAHLDTVFPAPTPLHLRRRGRITYLPGISDNGSGLAAALWAVRAAKEAGLEFRRPLIVVGNVGEEGEGNLRGIRHLFNAPPWEDRLCDFIAIDGAGLQRITHQALGSKRYRVRMLGPGGHSWADFGRPNPVHALGAAIHAFTATGAPAREGTSFNVGVIHGGISVNAIPAEASMEVDLRATTPGNLDELDQRLRRAISEAAGLHSVEVKLEVMGERPSGVTPAAAPLVQAAMEVTRWFGVEPHLDVGSTDANIPMSLGIPAIAIGAGGNCGNVHTPEEWFDPAQRDLGLQRLLGLIVVTAGLKD